MKYLNFILLQWFFVRLTRFQQRLITKVNVTHFSVGGGIGGNIAESQIQYWYSLQFFVLPLSGWFSDFIFLGKKRLVRITKRITT